MFAASAQDWSKVQELIARLEALREDSPECLAWLAPELAGLLEMPKALTFGLRKRERTSISFAHAAGPGLSSALVPRFDELLRTGEHAFLFDPDKLEPAQRNVALVLPPLLGIPASGVIVSRGARRNTIHLSPGGGLRDENRRQAWARLFADAGVEKDFVLRTLVCDGPQLLAWVGLFDSERPLERQRQILGSLIGPLQKRLKLEALVGNTAASTSALEMVFERIEGPAFLLAADGRIEHSNSNGRALVDTDPRIREMLREGVDRKRPDSAFDVTRLSWAGAPEHFFAVQRRRPEGHEARLDEAVRRWQLRPQGVRVLSNLVQGEANKTIAAKLGCAESTIELHVTRLLRQAGVESRAALIAKFWTTL